MTQEEQKRNTVLKFYYTRDSRKKRLQLTKKTGTIQVYLHKHIQNNGRHFTSSTEAMMPSAVITESLRKSHEIRMNKPPENHIYIITIVLNTLKASSEPSEPRNQIRCFFPENSPQSTPHVHLKCQAHNNKEYNRLLRAPHKYINRRHTREVK